MWIRTPAYRSQAGAELDIRILLAAQRSDVPIPPLRARLDVPSDAGGLEGTLDVFGAPEEGDVPTEPAPDEGEAGSGEPGSLPELLASLHAAPRNDEVRVELGLLDEPDGSLPAAGVRRRLDRVVTGEISVPVTVGES